MSLTAETIQKLKGKKFDEFYQQHENKWKAMVENAEEYVRTWLPQGEALHPADLANQIVVPLRVDPDFVQYSEKKKLTQKHWAQDFADYIVDQIHPTNI